MQSSPRRITSNPLLLRGKGEFLQIIHRTPNGRVFHCCNCNSARGRHGRYFLRSKRWDKSRRDHF